MDDEADGLLEDLDWEMNYWEFFLNAHIVEHPETKHRKLMKP